MFSYNLEFKFMLIFSPYKKKKKIVLYFVGSLAFLNIDFSFIQRFYHHHSGWHNRRFLFRFNKQFASQWLTDIFLISLASWHCSLKGCRCEIWIKYAFFRCTLLKRSVHLGTIIEKCVLRTGSSVGMWI